MFGRARLGMIPVVWLAVALAMPAAAAALPHLRGTWTAIQGLPDDASIRTAVGGSDGQLYVFGVCQDFCIQTNGVVHAGAPVTYIYEPQFDLWMSGRSAPRACVNAQAAVVGRDGQVRLAGCWTDMLTDPGFRIAIYNPADDTWRMRSGFGPYVNPIAGVVDGAGHALWYSETLRREGSAVFITGHRLVELVGGVWRKRAMEPANGPSDGAGMGADGKVYVAGGQRDCFPQFATCPVPKVAAWSRPSNSWSRPTSLPVPRIRVAVTGDTFGRIFTIGGMSANGATVFATVQVYSPATHAWFAVRRLPAARFGAVATYTPDGRVWVIGGYDESGNPLSDGYVFSDQ
jgi:Galactose oxidase, central domain